MRERGQTVPRSRVSPAVAIGLVIMAVALVLWQFVFKKNDSYSFSANDLPASMKTTHPPAQISGTIPRRSPQGSTADFAGTGAQAGSRAAQGPPGRR